MNLLLMQGNAKTIALADESVHCCVTSPPYYSLRDYSVDGQLGLEDTLDEYIENMVMVFREVKRVLRSDGTCWLNLGDSYVSQGGPVTEQWGDVLGQSDARKDSWTGNKVSRHKRSTLKPKDLMGVPWRVAFALQADGWWLRSDIIWSKPNPMPESVTDRPTKAHEYLFLLTKSARYYYDADAVREEHQGMKDLLGRKTFDNKGTHGGVRADLGRDRREYFHPSGRNRRTVWQIATAPYSGAHFATYPPALVEPCIKAGTSEHGVCPECGSPWKRVVSDRKPPKENLTKRNAPVDGMVRSGQRQGGEMFGSGQKMQEWLDANPKTTLGWQPTCECCEAYSRGRIRIPFRAVPATVFDPFAGSGTTLQVARALGRNGVGLDLSHEYLTLARKRLSLDALDAWTEGGKADGATVTDLPMFEELG